MTICKIEECNQIVWSKGLCLKHSPKTPLKIKKNSFKTSSKKVDILAINKQWEVFREIWEERKHECENCGKYLGSEPFSYMFDHLLEKSKYPNLKFEKDNIMVVCLPCHDKKTRGFSSDKVKLWIKILSEKYL